jgi:excisionase family DNA binding protein
MIRIANIDFLTVQETAKALGVTPQTVRTYIKQGRLKANRIGRPLLIMEESLKDFVLDKKEALPQ